MTDVEMKESNAATETKPDAQAAQEPTDRFYGKYCLYLQLTSLIELKKSLVLLEKAATDKDFKVCATLTKNLKKLRKQFSLPDSLLVLQHYNPDLYNRLKLAALPTEIEPSETAESKLHCTYARTKEIMALPET